jgi:hypothetical protein
MLCRSLPDRWAFGVSPLSIDVSRKQRRAGVDELQIGLAIATALLGWPSLSLILTGRKLTRIHFQASQKFDVALLPSDAALADALFFL